MIEFDPKQWDNQFWLLNLRRTRLQPVVDAVNALTKNGVDTTELREAVTLLYGVAWDTDHRYLFTTPNALEWPCVECGKEVEEQRHVYARPTCYVCLPPPPDLPTIPFPVQAEDSAE